MKKGKVLGKVVAIIVVVCVILGGCLVINKINNANVNEKLTDAETQKIIEDSYLDVLVNIQNYSKDNIDKEKVLTAGMRIAGKLNLVKDPTDSPYQYVLEEDINNKIVPQLTGMQMTEPIVIDVHKYYYPYNSEKKIYEIIPMGTEWIHIDKIKSAEKKGDIYYIECSASNGYEYFEYIDSVKIELQYKPDNKLVKYQLNSITSTKKWLCYADTKNIDFDKIVETETLLKKAKEYIEQYYSTTVNELEEFMLISSNEELNVYSHITNENMNIQNKLCLNINVQLTANTNILIYYDAYTGEFLGVKDVINTSIF